MSRLANETAPVALSPRQRLTVVTGLLLGILFAALDSTVVGTAMPRIIGELGGLSYMTWVTTLYLLTSTAVVPIAGKLADQIGRKPLYVTGMGLFMLGSALAGMSWDIWSLILFRGLQGIGGGVLFPLAMTISADIFTGQQRAKFGAFFGSVYFLAFIVGPQLGGWMVDHLSWRWVFYINLPVGILAVLCIWFGLKETNRRIKKEMDFAGILTIVTAVVSLLLALSLGGKEWAWDSWQIIVLELLAILATILFLRAERRAKEPVLDLEFFKHRIFVVTNVVGALQSFAMFGAMLFLPLYFQGVLDASASTSGAVLTPMMATMMVASFAAGQLLYKMPVRWIMVGGLGITALGFFMLTNLSLSTSWREAVLSMIVTGVGMGVLMPVLFVVVQESFPAEKRGVVTAANQFFRQIGGTIGIAILGIVLNHAGKTQLTDGISRLANSRQLPAGQVHEMAARFLQSPDATFRGLLVHAYGKMPESIVNMVKTALTETLHVVFWWSLAAILIGLGLSWFIGSLRLQKPDWQRKWKEENKRESVAQG